MFCFQCHRRLLLKAQIAQGSFCSPLFYPPQDNVLAALKRPSVQAQRTVNFIWVVIEVHPNNCNSAVRYQFAKMTRSGSFEENIKVVKGRLHKFTARNGLSTSTACNEINQMVLPPRLVFTQAMLLLPLSSWTLTGVYYLYLFRLCYL